MLGPDVRRTSRIHFVEPVCGRRRCTCAILSGRRAQLQGKRQQQKAEGMQVQSAAKAGVPLETVCCITPHAVMHCYRMTAGFLLVAGRLSQHPTSCCSWLHVRGWLLAPTLRKLMRRPGGLAGWVRGSQCALHVHRPPFLCFQWTRGLLVASHC